MPFHHILAQKSQGTSWQWTVTRQRSMTGSKLWHGAAGWHRAAKVARPEESSSVALRLELELLKKHKLLKFERFIIWNDNDFHVYTRLAFSFDFYSANAMKRFLLSLLFWIYPHSTLHVCIKMKYLYINIKSYSKCLTLVTIKPVRKPLKILLCHKISLVLKHNRLSLFILHLFQHCFQIQGSVSHLGFSFYHSSTCCFTRETWSTDISGCCFVPVTWARIYTIPEQYFVAPSKLVALLHPDISHSTLMNL